MTRKIGFGLAAAALVVILAGGVAFGVPSIRERITQRMDTYWTDIQYTLNPPQKAVFVPQEDPLATAVEATLAAMNVPGLRTPLPAPQVARVISGQVENPPAQSAAPTPISPPTPAPTPTFAAPPTPATPLPSRVAIKNLTHEYQQFNNCGPATLSVALTHWGWKGDQRNTREYLRPGWNGPYKDDKNVNPSEMVDYVRLKTQLKALWRAGGDPDLLKRLTAAGFPVIIERGFEPPKEDWMGHYELISGYDDATRKFIAQDVYILPDLPVSYDEIAARWRDFNYTYMVVYPPEREAELMQALGPRSDEAYSFRLAADVAGREVGGLAGRDAFFALYNLGSSLTGLKDYAAAAGAYDQAFRVYARLPENERPWRMLWYQTGPYEAYYNTGRYKDVIDLATQTLVMVSKPILEESFYWRGLARKALGDERFALDDMQKAAALNSNYAAPAEMLKAWGATP
jgi:tetratricopeptide (TPR) repeat protein